MLTDNNRKPKKLLKKREEDQNSGNLMGAKIKVIGNILTYMKGEKNNDQF